MQDELDRLNSTKHLRWSDLATSHLSQLFASISQDIQSQNARQILWHASHDQGQPLCACGQPLSWHLDKRKYRDYCSKRCTAIYTQAKIRDTHLRQRGVAHHSQTPGFKSKIAATSRARYGRDHYSQTDEYRQRVIATNSKNYGTAYPAQNELVKAKMRGSFIANLGVENPMQHPDIKQRQELTNISRYGVANPLSSLTVRSKAQATMLQTHGAAYALQVPKIAKTAAIKRRVNHYSAYAYQRIHDPDWLSAENASGKSISEIADELGISSSNLCKIFHRHGLDIRKHFRSAMERDLSAHLETLGMRVVTNDRSVIRPFEIDLWLPDHRLGIELNGAYYHSETQGKGPSYHLKKTQAAESRGIKLLQFFDWEVFSKQDVITDKIQHLLQLNHRINARSLRVIVPDSQMAWRFFESNHMQGGCFAAHTMALANDEGEILAAMSFGKSRYNKRYRYEMLRFASANGLAVRGAASRLLQHFVNQHCVPGDKIISYCNRRWSEGQLYERLGFTRSHASPPSYYYIQRNGQYAGTRQQFQKHLLPSKLDHFDPNRSEIENMQANGFTRVWDCGQIAYVYGVT